MLFLKVTIKSHFTLLVSGIESICRLKNGNNTLVDYYGSPHEVDPHHSTRPAHSGLDHPYIKQGYQTIMPIHS